MQYPVFSKMHMHAHIHVGYQKYSRKECPNLVMGSQLADHMLHHIKCTAMCDASKCQHRLIYQMPSAS